MEDYMRIRNKAQMANKAVLIWRSSGGQKLLMMRRGNDESTIRGSANVS